MARRISFCGQVRKAQLTLIPVSSTIFVCALLIHVVAVVVPPGVVPES